MKGLLLLIVMFCLASCGVAQNANGTSQKIKIDLIEDTKLTDFYFIKFHFLDKNEGGILVSKMGVWTCEEKLIVGSEYQINLDKLKSTAGITETSFRLNVNNIYIDGKLIFPKNEFFYTSKSIKSLCLN